MTLSKMKGNHLSRDVVTSDADRHLSTDTVSHLQAKYSTMHQLMKRPKAQLRRVRFPLLLLTST